MNREGLCRSFFFLICFNEQFCLLLRLNATIFVITCQFIIDQMAAVHIKPHFNPKPIKVKSAVLTRIDLHLHRLLFCFRRVICIFRVMRHSNISTRRLCICLAPILGKHSKAVCLVDVRCGISYCHEPLTLTRSLLEFHLRIKGGKEEKGHSHLFRTHDMKGHLL